MGVVGQVETMSIRLEMVIGPGPGMREREFRAEVMERNVRGRHKSLRDSV